MNNSTLNHDNHESIRSLYALTRALHEHSESLAKSIAADGWPLKMAIHGMECHLRTWDPDLILKTARAECRKLDLPYNPSHPSLDRLTLSIWPKLPGAGVTPLLYGVALGFKHHAIRPSREGLQFAYRFQDLARKYASLNVTIVDPTQPLEQRSEFREASVIIVSGSDETVQTIQSLASKQQYIKQYITGYHHRESLDIVELSPATRQGEMKEIARRVAEDIVLWHQSGCFSARRLIILSNNLIHRVIEKFAISLSRAIATLESRWDAVPTDPDLHTQRNKEIQVATIIGEVWPAKFGWVSMGDESKLIKVDDNILRRLTTPHTIELELCYSIDEVKWPPAQHFQAVGVHAAKGNTELLDSIRRTASRHGATRLCQIGKLQQPPGSWRHDGKVNITPWIPILENHC